MRGVAASLLVIAGILGACSNVPEVKPSCFTVGCGAHGKCELVGDSESCVCEVGYAGTSCAECASGFQDVDSNGLCSSSCGDCGPHARCSEVSGRAVCSCFVGYSPHKGAGCIFTGGPVDPGFDAPQPNGWRTSGAVRISTGRPSNAPDGTGWARFSGFGEVSQSFEMPRYEDAEPLVLEVDVACLASGTCRNVRPAASIVFDGVPLDSYFLVPYTSSPGSIDTMRFCLGERAFGRTLELGLRRYPSSSSTNKGGEDALVGRVQILPSADCAVPGTVTNGDFEAGAWETGQPERVEVVQESGTHVARLAAACGDDPAVVTSSLSIPGAMSRPALSFSINGKGGGSTAIVLGDAVVGQVDGTGTKEKAVVCLPEWTRGFAFSLGVVVKAPSDCAAGPNVVLVDDFVVASDPSCDDDIGNSGFERPGLSPWSGEQASVVSADAHSGNAYLALRPTCTNSARITAPFMVPPRGAGADGGVAVRFWYRRPEGVGASVRAGDGFDAPEHSLDRAATWTERVICLPPHSWGHRAFVEFTAFQQRRDECSEGLDIDDVSVGTDPQCLVD